MFTHILIPFLLMSNMYVQKGPGLFPTEYEFDFDYYFRPTELDSSVKLIGKLICHSFKRYTTLRCILQDVKSRSESTFKIKENWQLTKQYVEKDYNFSQLFWFDIFFNDKIGAHAIRIRDEYWKLVEGDIQIKEEFANLIKSLAYLFKIDSEKISKNLVMQSTSGSSVFTSTETSIVGTCETEYNMTVTFNETNDDSLDDFRIVPTFLTQYFTEKKDIYVQIEKYVKAEDKNKDYKCDKQNLREVLRMKNGEDDIYMVNNIYKMKIVNDQLYISNTINVDQPIDPSNMNPYVMYQETFLSLSDIKHSHVFCDQTYDHWNNKWVKFKI